MPHARRTGRFSRQKAARRAAIGLIFAVVGLVWLALALRYTNRLTAQAIGYLGLAGATALVGFLAVQRSARQLPRVHATTAETARIRRIVVAINILEWVAVATAVSVLMLLHLPEYILTASGIIVGLYLYPIAGAMRAPLQTVTASLLVAWNVGALALLPRWRQSSLGAGGTGSILLASSAVTLCWALWRTRSAGKAIGPSNGTEASAEPIRIGAAESADSLTR